MLAPYFRLDATMPAHRLIEIARAVRAQVDARQGPFTPKDVDFLDHLAQHGLNAPRASLVWIAQLLRHLPTEQRVGTVTAADLAQAWSLAHAEPTPWPAPREQPAAMGTSPGALCWALKRLDATFALARTPEHIVAAQAYQTLRQAFLPFTEISPNPCAPAFAAVPVCLAQLDDVFAVEVGCVVPPAVQAYRTLRQACFESRDRTRQAA